MMPHSPSPRPASLILFLASNALHRARLETLVIGLALLPVTARYEDLRPRFTRAGEFAGPVLNSRAAKGVSPWIGYGGILLPVLGELLEGKLYELWVELSSSL
ncbi:hypothetical protein BOTBODRAFT_298159 [Botryobasidium botryosum FD-172 SS1]|uniref:Uncharacterized protein n=1 Tax=Botryobasidium botryosum (strain FD-172 SS1) TaxID=930990 RepID=A0A067MII8_BOTB1|nr:hypothetical protein BOTBODRAFT_298159 [Botryobasidium botryosum FD-172 SS1]